MKTRIATSFGLALMLFMGVFVTMLALGATPVLGDHAGAGEIGTVQGESEPTDPGAAAKFTVKFIHGAVGDDTADLAGAVDSITVEFEDDIKVPSIIDPSTVTITTTRFSNDKPTIPAPPQGPWWPTHWASTWCLTERPRTTRISPWISRIWSPPRLPPVTRESRVRVKLPVLLLVLPAALVVPQL